MIDLLRAIVWRAAAPTILWSRVTKMTPSRWKGSSNGKAA